MQCRPNCGACCIEPAISKSFINMPQGKAAGEVCSNLDLDSLKCRVWGSADYPDFCKKFTAEPAFCGENRDDALQILRMLEHSTRS